MPREFSVASCATRIFEAATIFMADVIFPIFPTDRMRSLTAHRGTHHSGHSQRSNVHWGSANLHGVPRPGTTQYSRPQNVRKSYLLEAWHIGFLAPGRSCDRQQ